VRGLSEAEGLLISWLLFYYATPMRSLFEDNRGWKIVESMEAPIPDFDSVDKKKIEADVRGILKIEDDEKPVILDLESVRVLGNGKFEIDIVSLMNRRPIVFKLSEGKYIIDIEGM